MPCGRPAVADSATRAGRSSSARRSLVVLVSGTGSNLQALIDACANETIAAEVAGVISNVDNVYALDRADDAGIASQVVTARNGEDRATYDTRLADVVAAYDPDFVVLAGWMRILTSNFLDRYQVINLHPALPGEFPGLHAIERALADARDGHRDHTGVMVHFVPDEGVDDGPVIASTRVPILADDDLATLTARVHSAEHRLLVDAIGALCGAESASAHIATPSTPSTTSRRSIA